MGEDTIKVRIEADGQQAKAELAGVSQSLDDLGDSAKQAGAGTGSLEGALSELRNGLPDLLGKLGQIVGTVGAAVATFKVFYQGTREVIDGLESLGVEIDGPLTSAFQKLTDAVVGADAELGEIKTAFNTLSEEQLRAQSILDKYVGGLQKKREELVATALAIERQVASEKAAGEVQRSTLEWIQKALDSYAALGDTVPAALQKVADSLGIMSSEQEKAAEAAEKASEQEAEAAERAAAKEEERAAREVEAHAKRVAAALEAALAKEEAAAREVAAAQAAVRAVEGELEEFADAQRTPEALGKLNEELDELRSQPFLTDQQMKRLNDLQDITGSLAVSSRDWRVEREKTIAQEKILDKLDDARRKEYQAEEEQLDSLIDSLHEQNREFRENAEVSRDAGGAAGEAALSFRDLERQNAENLETMGRFGKATAQAAGSLENVGDAAGGIGEQMGELSEETDKAETGFSKMNAQADELIPKLERIEELVERIKKEAASISLGL